MKKEDLKGLSGGNADVQHTKRNAALDYALEESRERKDSWELEECPTWYSLLKNVTVFYTCYDNLSKVELKVMIEIVWQRKFQESNRQPVALLLITSVFFRVYNDNS